MNTPAPTDHPVHELVTRRWSPRAFSERAVDGETLASLLEAARWSPSCFNEQPWRFLVSTTDRPEDHARVAGALSAGNRPWAGRAPVLMVAVAQDTFARNGRPNRFAGYDVGQAVAWLTVEATARGLFVHQMAGFDRDVVTEAFGVPEGYTVLTAIAVGWPGRAADLPEESPERDRSTRSRRPLAELAFAGRWDAPWRPDSSTG